MGLTIRENFRLCENLVSFEEIPYFNLLNFQSSNYILNRVEKLSDAAELTRAENSGISTELRWRNYFFFTFGETRSCRCEMHSLNPVFFFNQHRLIRAVFCFIFRLNLNGQFYEQENNFIKDMNIEAEHWSNKLSGFRKSNEKKFILLL